MVRNILSDIKSAPLNFSLTVLLAGIFFFSSIPKIADPVDFAVNLNNYRLFPQEIIPWLAIWFPWLEITLAFTLLFGIYKKEALAITVLVYAIFFLVIGWALYQGLDISCGCFGQDPAETSSLGLRLVEDFALLFIAVWLFLNTGKSASDRQPNKEN